MLGLYTDTARPTDISTVAAKPNVFVDFQIIKVNDTIAPNILVLENLAIEVLDPPEDTELPNDDDSCSEDDSGTVMCHLTIEPPAVFDIADPFPTLSENFTSGDGTFTEIEGALKGDFPVQQVSTIGWKAVDFRGNGQKNIVTQTVNIKFEGTNKAPDVRDVEVGAFSDLATQIEVLANDTEKDPIKFSIVQNQLQVNSHYL